MKFTPSGEAIRLALRNLLSHTSCRYFTKLRTAQLRLDIISSSKLLITMHYPKIVLFGDSITQFCNKQPGFSLQLALQDDYQRKADVVNRGFSGYNSDHAVALLPKVLAEFAGLEIKLMTIFFGTNDATTFTDHIGEIQLVPIDRYKANLASLLELASQQNIKVIVVGPAFHDGKLSNEFFATRERDVSEGPSSSCLRNREYSQAAQEVAMAHGSGFVDLWRAFQQDCGIPENDLDSADHSKYLCDGLHFTPHAYELFYDELTATIREKYPELTPDVLKSPTAYYRDIDPTNLDSIFV